MALDTERRSVGVKAILRKLRGTAPRPVSPEDQIEGMYEKGGELPGEKSDEEALGEAGQPGLGQPTKQRNPLLPKPSRL